ncbi:hypothetical protein LMH87_004694 [Akanthomyces muscarius]|uniref:RTA1 domain protein n=1 Tax=Akanthomyces muscarius TaxID=2231603 RepID=A0A9W8Q659_AKAMU|nr:hypothetical protein LMH87_004694 [Akanthomyces muscarius]KAJ4145862.1 hypothetical protein LMH87_004694 [Akanthomyces muscarius]
MQTFLGIRYKVKSSSWVVGVACFGEVLGYAARVVLSKNPFDEYALATQYVALIGASGFFAAGVYLSLKYAVLAISPQHSIIRPKLYTWIFISCDVVCLILQVDASGVASAANTDSKITTTNLNIVLLVGICLQALTLLVFGVMAGLYARAVFRNRRTLEPAAAKLLRSRQFRKFVLAMSLAYLVLLIRSLYRIGAYSGGWKNSISRDQVSFMILDGLMCVFAALAMTLIQPGIYFKAMSSQNRDHHSQGQKSNGIV